MVHASQHIHLVGIGGIGMSGLARLLHAKGKTITGSDLSASLITSELAQIGIAVTIGRHAASTVPAEAGLVVRSQAVGEDNPEIAEARRRAVPVVTYAEAVAELTRPYELITVSGTHGKTTTTSLLGHILRLANLEPTILVGSRVAQFGGNAVLGKGKYFVLEADEYAKSFHAYHPSIAVVTNIDLDHVDTYQNIAEVVTAFSDFYSRIRPGGSLVVPAEDQQVARSIRAYKGNIRTYGVQRGDLQARDIARSPSGTSFTIAPDNVRVSTKLHGTHNVMNVLAACTVAGICGVPLAKAAEALASFHGSWRRFERIGAFHGIPVVSDYGHHPVEIRATLQAAREAYPDHRVVLVFQPHQHRRLQALFPEFVQALASADVLLLTHVYAVAGRESTDAAAPTALDLAKEVKKNQPHTYFAGTLGECEITLQRIVRRGDVLLVMGAGDIHLLAMKLAHASDGDAVPGG